MNLSASLRIIRLNQLTPLFLGLTRGRAIATPDWTTDRVCRTIPANASEVIFRWQRNLATR